MKRVVLRPSIDGKTGTSSKEVLTQVVINSPHRPLGVEQIRRRVTIQEALESADDHVLLEDADHAVLVEAVENFPWSLANKELLNIIDDVLKAESVQVAALSVVPGKNKHRDREKETG